jgi:hypothetical protein
VEESAIDGALQGRPPLSSLDGVEELLFVGIFFTEVLLRGLPARDDRFQEDRMLVLDVRLRAKRFDETSP